MSTFTTPKDFSSELKVFKVKSSIGVFPAMLTPANGANNSIILSISLLSIKSFWMEMSTWRTLMLHSFKSCTSFITLRKSGWDCLFDASKSRHKKAFSLSVKSSSEPSLPLAWLATPLVSCTGTSAGAGVCATCSCIKSRDIFKACSLMVSMLSTKAFTNAYFLGFLGIPPSSNLLRTSVKSFTGILSRTTRSESMSSVKSTWPGYVPPMELNTIISPG